MPWRKAAAASLLARAPAVPRRPSEKPTTAPAAAAAKSEDGRDSVAPRRRKPEPSSPQDCATRNWAPAIDVSNKLEPFRPQLAPRRGKSELAAQAQAQPEERRDCHHRCNPP